MQGKLIGTVVNLGLYTLEFAFFLYIITNLQFLPIRQVLIQAGEFGMVVSLSLMLHPIPFLLLRVCTYKELLHAPMFIGLHKIAAILFVVSGSLLIIG